MNYPQDDELKIIQKALSNLANDKQKKKSNIRESRVNKG